MEISKTLLEAENEKKHKQLVDKMNINNNQLDRFKE